MEKLLCVSLGGHEKPAQQDILHKKKKNQIVCYLGPPKKSLHREDSPEIFEKEQ